MLHIEKGGREQIPGELEAYNPLIPQGRELIATLMLEIEDAAKRNRELYRLAGIEEAAYIELQNERIPCRPTEYDERTTPDGKTSSVHWVRFVFTPEQIGEIPRPARARGSGRRACRLRPYGRDPARGAQRTRQGFRLIRLRESR